MKTKLFTSLREKSNFLLHVHSSCFFKSFGFFGFLSKESTKEKEKFKGDESHSLNSVFHPHKSRDQRTRQYLFNSFLDSVNLGYFKKLLQPLYFSTNHYGCPLMRPIWICKNNSSKLFNTDFLKLRSYSKVKQFIYVIKLSYQILHTAQLAESPQILLYIFMGYA